MLEQTTAHWLKTNDIYIGPRGEVARVEAITRPFSHDKVEMKVRGLALLHEGERYVATFDETQEVLLVFRDADLCGIIDDIVDDLRERSGLGDAWDGIDRDIQDDIKLDWKNLILSGL